MLTRLNYLDGLRGFAICGVVLIHVGANSAGLPAAIRSLALYGYRGVSLFFILSAFLLAFVSSGRAMNLKAFYARRFFRVAPMFYLGIILYSLMANLGGHGSRFNVDGISGFEITLTTLFLHGFSPQAINGVMPGGWSIATEAMFYAIFPAIIAIVTTLRRSVVFLAGSYAIAVLFRVITKLALIGSMPSEAVANYIHFAFPAYLPAFAWGLLLYHFAKSDFASRISPRQGFALMLTSLLAMTLAGLTGNSLLASSPVSPPLQAMLVLGAGISGSRLFDNPIMRHIGVVSFSIYVVHWAIIAALEPWLGAIPVDPVLRFGIGFTLVLALSTALSTLTHRFIERPMINVGRKVGAPRDAPPVPKAI